MEFFGANPDLEELEYQFSCGLCFEPFSEPRTLNCSHSLCGGCLLAVYKKNPLCPFCRTPFSPPLPPVNESLQRRTAAYLAIINNNNKVPVVEEEIYNQQDTAFLRLPSDVTSEIFGNLSWRETVRSFGVCKQLQSNLADQFLWKGYCDQEFPFCDTDTVSSGSWKDIFRIHTQMKIGWNMGRPKDFKMTPWRGHENYVSCFSIYKKNVVSGSADNTVRLWRFGEGESQKTYEGHQGLINCVKFSEVMLVSGSSDNSARVWDTQSATCYHTLKHEGSVETVSFNEREVCTSSNDRCVRLWDIRTGEVTHKMEGYSAPIQVDALNGGHHILSVSDDEIRVWDIRSGLDNNNNNNRAQCLHNMPTAGVTHSQFIGNNILFTGHSDGQVVTWDISSGAKTGSVQLDNNGKHSPINCLAADTTKVIVGMSNNLIVLDVNMQQQTVLKDHSAPVNDVKFNDHRAVSCGQDGCIKVWDLKTGNRLFSLLGGSLQARGRNPVHPTRPGFSNLQFDQSRIVASVNNMLRVYSFCVDNDKN